MEDLSGTLLEYEHYHFEKKKKAFSEIVLCYRQYV